MANENAAIWEVQSGAANGTEATATSTHTQLFNPDSNKIEDGAYIDGIAISLRKASPENEAANTDNNELQDMGISGLDITLSGTSGNADSDVAANWVNKLIKWIKDGGTTTGYKKGRFGLRLDNAPQWNVVPNGDANSLGTTYGFHILNPSWEYVGERTDLVRWSLTLSLGGDPLNAI
jgi:hypothetical protein